MDKYLDDHPKADPSNHRVVERKDTGGGSAKEEKQPKMKTFDHAAFSDKMEMAFSNHPDAPDNGFDYDHEYDKKQANR